MVAFVQNTDITVARYPLFLDRGIQSHYQLDEFLATRFAHKPCCFRDIFHRYAQTKATLDMTQWKGTGESHDFGDTVLGCHGAWLREEALRQVQAVIPCPNSHGRGWPLGRNDRRSYQQSSDCIQTVGRNRCFSSGPLSYLTEA